MSELTILAIETSSSIGSVALTSAGRVVEARIATPREQTERVLGLIDELLAGAGVTLDRLDAIVFGRGPGSFTGLRIAAAVVQGLSLAAARPIVAVSSLAALAAQGFRRLGIEPASAEPLQALCLLDARMGEVYSASFRLVHGLATPVAAEAIGTPAQVPHPGEPFFVVGDAIGVFAAEFEALVAEARACLPDLAPKASDLIELARPDIEAGRFMALEAALPVYLREADAWRRTGR